MPRGNSASDGASSTSCPGATASGHRPLRFFPASGAASINIRSRSRSGATAWRVHPGLLFEAETAATVGSRSGGSGRGSPNSNYRPQTITQWFAGPAEPISPVPSGDACRCWSTRSECGSRVEANQNADQISRRSKTVAQRAVPSLSAQRGVD
jgi:hypothetical protein